MEVLRLDSPDALAAAAAGFIARCAVQAISDRGRFVLALSGGSTPWKMLNRLAGLDLPWQQVHLAQVDERCAPRGDASRNLTHIEAQFAQRIAFPQQQLHAMPVNEPDLDQAVRDYATTLTGLAGHPPVLDLVHLGLGSDGHTASLLPGDALLEQDTQDVGMSGGYQGHARMSLTFPLINRSRNIMWLISGEEKRGMLERLLQADPGIPAGKVSQENTLVFTDIPD